MTIILTHDNYLNIDSIEDARSFESIKKEKCNELFENGSIEDKINAICISKFGQSKEEIENLIKKYGEDIESINDEDLQFYIRSGAEILSSKDTEILNRIFYNVEPVENVNSIAIERNLKNEYGKLYNEGLFEISEAVKSKELGKNIYEVPIDENGNIANFNMIITSIAPFVKNNPDNFYDDWNRPNIGSQHFCANYIRRDMLGRVSMPHLYYGFSNMKDDSLMISGTRDIFSSGVSFVSSANSSCEEYLSPDKQINRTTGYNEMDFRRMQNGERKQPDYIVLFRVKGNIYNIEKAKMASEQFKQATGKALPIVIIDQDKCLETERKIVNNMIDDFNNNPSQEQANLICQKIRNNQVTNDDFANDIDYSNIEKYAEGNSMKQAVTIDEIEQCFEKTNPEERERFVQKFKSFYQAINNEKRKEVKKDYEGINR